MNTKVISPGELAVGQNVTVLRWFRDVNMESEFGNTLVKTEISDGSYKGDVLTVKAIDLPFIICDTNRFRGMPMSLDTRRVELMELSSEYVKASQ